MSANMEEIIRAGISTAQLNMKRMLDNPELFRSIENAVNMVVGSYKAGGCIFACGNGGSASDAQHFIAELVSKLSKDRKPLKGFSMTVDTSILTAVGNDYGYEYSFHRQVKANMTKNDVLLAITTSGNSKNILYALDACQEIGAKSILLSGHKGGPAAAKADQVILAPGDFTGAIQECHLVIYHLLCYLIEVQMIDAGLCRYEQSYPLPGK